MIEMTEEEKEDTEVYKLCGLMLYNDRVRDHRHMDSYVKFIEEQLPPREKFKNLLTNKDCSFEDYYHAKNLWEAFECKNL